MAQAPVRTWGWPQAAGAAAVAAGAAMLTSLTVAYTIGRLTEVRLSRWLVAGVALLGTQCLLVGVATRSGSAPGPEAVDQVIDATIAVTVLGMVVADRVLPGTAGAGLAGVAAAILVAGAHRLRGPRGDQLTVPAEVVVALLVLVTAAVVAAYILRCWAPAGARWLLAGGVLALAVQRIATDFPASDAPAWDAVALVAAILGALLLAASSVDLVRVQIAAGTRGERPTDAVAALRADARAARAQLHEVRATVAGVLSASNLLEEEELPESARRQLTRLLHEETARLQRLLEAHPAEPAAFDLDDAIGPVILARRSTGQVIEWDRSCSRVFARRDDVAQVISILLDNAASHASGATVRISSTTQNGRIELRVRDNGPGVAPEIADRVFDWGVHGATSDGSGIGLHVASRLMSEAGGYLRTDSRDQGAEFVIGLPTPEAAGARR